MVAAVNASGGVWCDYQEVTSEEEEGPIYEIEKWSVGFRRQGKGR